MDKDMARMPSIFLGTAPFHEMGDYRFRRVRTISAVKNGICLGYGIDCAQAYGNHRQVGRGMRISGRSREEIFVTSKLYNTQQDNKVREHYHEILKELGGGRIFGFILAALAPDKHLCKYMETDGRIVF